MTNFPSMEDIRLQCAERIAAKLEAVTDLVKARQLIGAEGRDDNGIGMETPRAATHLRNNGRRDFTADLRAVMQHTDLLMASIRYDVWLDVEQYVQLLVRDVIVEGVRSEDFVRRNEPIYMLTGNQMAPTYRAIDVVETIWQADDSGYIVHELWSMIEKHVDNYSLYIDTVEDDGAIYVVDLKRWRYVEPEEADADPETLADSWVSIN